MAGVSPVSSFNVYGSPISIELFFPLVVGGKSCAISVSMCSFVRFSFAYSSGESASCCSSWAACFSCVKVDVIMALRVSEISVEVNSAKSNSIDLSRLVAIYHHPCVVVVFAVVVFSVW